MSENKTPIQPAPQRIEKLENALLASPLYPGPAIDDRPYWETLKSLEKFQQIIDEARKFAPLPPEPLTREMYLGYSQEGRRGAYDEPVRKNRRRLVNLVLAECMENKGEFLPAIQTYLEAACDEICWVMPAHDPQLKNFRGEQVDIDLLTSSTAWNLAQTLHVLGDRLDPKTRERVLAELDRRVWKPFLDMVHGKREPAWWMTPEANNWNAVCLAGVVGSALAANPSTRQQAEILAAMEEYLPFFLNSLEQDGYCSEGIGYWNYGFGHFIMLSDVTYRATGGKLDLLANEQAQRGALFAKRIQIVPGAYPIFADGWTGTRAANHYVNYLAARMEGKKLSQEDLHLLWPAASTLYENLIFFTDDNAARFPTQSLLEDMEAHPLRSWFPVAGVLVARLPDPGENTLAVAMKGGHNAEQHNHNDVGSYVVTVGDVSVLVDPGAEVYTARTFSKNRYDSKMLSSYGHSVPLPAGKLQETGREARATVLATAFTDTQDTLTLDLAKAYNVPGLKTLTRTFEYSRDGRGKLTVTDQAEFTQPERFETAVVTFGTAARNHDRSLTVTESGKSVRIEIDAQGNEYTLVEEVLDEELPKDQKPNRIGIRLNAPANSATIRVIITPE